MSYSIRSCRLYIRLPPGNMGQKIQTGTIPALRDVDHEVGINDLSPRCANLFFHIQPARIPRTPNATRTQSASLVVLLCVDCRIILGVKHASVHLLLCMVGRRQSLSIDSAARWCGSPVPITAAPTVNIVLVRAYNAVYVPTNCGHVLYVEGAPASYSLIPIIVHNLDVDSYCFAPRWLLVPSDKKKK